MSPIAYKEVNANGASVFFGPRKSAWLWPLESLLAASGVKAMDAVEALLLTQNGFMGSWTLSRMSGVACYGAIREIDANWRCGLLR